jgi:hypothetical protein
MLDVLLYSFLFSCTCQCSDFSPKHVINQHNATIYDHLKRINVDPSLSKYYKGKLEMYRITKDQDFINIYQLGDLDNFFLKPIQYYSRYQIVFKAYHNQLLSGDFILILRKSPQYPWTERSVFITTDVIDTKTMQLYIDEFLKTH